MLARRCLRLLTSTRPPSLMQVAVGRGLYTDAFMTIDIFKDRRVSRKHTNRDKCTKLLTDLPVFHTASMQQLCYYGQTSANIFQGNQ